MIHVYPIIALQKSIDKLYVQSIFQHVVLSILYISKLLRFVYRKNNCSKIIYQLSIMIELSRKASDRFNFKAFVVNFAGVIREIMEVIFISRFISAISTQQFIKRKLNIAKMQRTYVVTFSAPLVSQQIYFKNVLCQ